MRTPTMYIVHYDRDGHAITHGPYFTITCDGCGLVIGQDWIAYKVQDRDLRFRKITVPTRHYITTLKS